MIPRSLYDSDHDMFRDSVRKFIETEAMPHHEQWENDGMVSDEIWLKAGEQGFLCPTVPEEYGGVGADFRYNCIVNEEIGRSGCTGLGWTLHSDIAVPYIVRYGSDEQKQKYLPRCVTGELITAIAMTEPAAGSDLQGTKTTAVLDGDDYVINGSKTFITNGQKANLVIVVAKTDTSAGSKGISLFLVEAGTPGFSKGKNLKKLGMKAQDTSELFFQDVRVPKANLLGELGRGFVYLMQDLPQERLSVAVGANGMCQALLELTVNYVKERKAFGTTVATFQNTQFKLAELAAEISCAEVFLDRCTELLIADKLDTVTASKLKLLTTDLQCRVADECLQLHGGWGYMWEYPVCRAFADSRVQRIYAGTNEIMKLIIARDLMK
ncbi:MAG: acyl-CoA dehydrogenase family protein [Porticoccaceae bacterium]|jgi:alkylation response protein AidB-like acyl-CoA dehydrogenase|nr:acyl-CoA dehydrogenase family protein [Porticoccaceae bacterium]MDP4655170.1 acyl-CoA dehydrogenase family protein [Alphaproteobacteria bacterium]MDP4745913.1 acyl-CoA dehydrogenase family protein [Porticoccaceae bacterium]MDP4753685.1 acyl-CoA dehydrogenase family protein [Porticoccaceae bacterium]MDP4890738.1 acyl-CoA dehydrogenase family protein [Porticoccaceae bacterium]|tara:strand:- start:10015 stop:11157 length:1143 start_codon:yes stop_codon:yes gene_type:complete